MKNKIKLKKGDEVIVLTGKDKGKTGKITTIKPSVLKAIVAGINKYKKHQKPDNNQKGGIIEKEMPIDISNVSLIDPKDRKPTKVGFRFLEDGRKVRYAKRSGEVIDR